MSIVISDLSFSYGVRPVLENVNAAAREGEFLSVVGPNGVGKSTLFYCILGILNNFRGHIRINSRDNKRIVKSPPCSREKSDALAGMSREAGNQPLKRPGYNQISGGERQLVLIAGRGPQTRILILDEPTANLDFGNQILVLTQIKSLAREGYTIIQSTHNPEQAFMFSDSVLALHNGRVLASGPPANIITEELMYRLYGVDIKVQSLFQDKVRVCVPSIVIGNNHHQSRDRITSY